MIIDAVLRKLGDLERSLAELYGWYAEAFVSDPEIAFVFFKMASEEKGHASLVEYQKRIVRGNAALSVDVEIDDAGIEAALSRVRELRAAATRPTVEEAVRETLLLERTAAESHCRNALRQANPEIARLLDALGGEDKLHVERVEALARKRGIGIAPPPSP